jgi:hypothetical protein
VRPPHLPERKRPAGPNGDNRWNPAVESQAVRQYRFLLRTASPEAVEAAHAEALLLLGRSRRTVVLEAVREGLGTGQRQTPEEVLHLAHLITAGERRRPGAFLTTCDPEVLHDLAVHVILAEASFGLFGGYAAWDGAEPEAPSPGPDESAWGERWHDRLVSSPQHTDANGNPAKPTSVWEPF